MPRLWAVEHLKASLLSKAMLKIVAPGLQGDRNIKGDGSGAEEMAHWLRSPASLQEDPFSSTNTHMVAHNIRCVRLRGSDTRHAYGAQTCMQQNTPTRKNKNKSEIEM